MSTQCYYFRRTLAKESDPGSKLSKKNDSSKGGKAYPIFAGVR